MSRVIPFALALLLTLGCKRQVKDEVAPEVATAALDPVPVVAPPVPDDDRVPPPRLVRVRTRDESLRDGVAWLLAQQSDDGAWRSDVYATFKDGTALTPLVVTAIQEAHNPEQPDKKKLTAIKNGLSWLAQFTRDGTVKPPADGFDYPVYTAALALKALSHPTAQDFAGHRAPWVKYLKERQLTDKLGWKEEDKQFGGWGYCRVVPKKPEPGALAPSLIESNLSATLFALEALEAADDADPETRKAAAAFVRRCQNWLPPIPGVPLAWSQHLDGGFHFIYDDPTRNKAGAVPKQDGWPPLFHSYGSTTADGLRAVSVCAQADDTHRRDAARAWLVRHFRADSHPGSYITAHERNRDAVYFYYAASAARAFRDHRLELPGGRDWAAELTSELVLRQAKDGSWTNPIELVRENDPVVATSNAVLALARCRTR